MPHPTILLVFFERLYVILMSMDIFCYHQLSYYIFFNSVDRSTNDSIPLTSIAAANLITSYTGGLPLLPLFNVSYGDPNSFATLSANSILSRKVISTLSILPLNGLLVLIDQGRFFSGLSEYFSSLAISWTKEFIVLSTISSMATSIGGSSFIGAIIFPGMSVSGSVMPVKGSHSLVDRTLFTRNSDGSLVSTKTMFLYPLVGYVSGVILKLPHPSSLSL